MRSTPSPSMVRDGAENASMLFEAACMHFDGLAVNFGKIIDNAMSMKSSYSPHFVTANSARILWVELLSLVASP